MNETRKIIGRYFENEYFILKIVYTWKQNDYLSFPSLFHFMNLKMLVRLEKFNYALFKTFWNAKRTDFIVYKIR